jgi:hypothetical protein
MTSLENVTFLEIDHNVFESDETRILSAAFGKAWAYVEFDPLLATLNVSDRQSELARCLMALLKLGETEPVSLANSAIRKLRQNLSVTGHHMSGRDVRALELPRVELAAKVCEMPY